MHEYLTQQEVADLLRVSVDTVRRWIRSKQLRAINVGNSKLRPRMRIRREWLDAFERSRMVPDPRVTTRRLLNVPQYV